MYNVNLNKVNNMLNKINKKCGSELYLLDNNKILKYSEYHNAYLFYCTCLDICIAELASQYNLNAKYYSK